VLGPDGRLAVSDVVVEGEPPTVPDPIERALCLSGPRDRDRFYERIEAAGFTIDSVNDHRDDLLAMRDDIMAAVDYEQLCSLLGERGAELEAGIDRLDEAVADGTIGYISVVAMAN
jgi:hypothetical protein